MRGLIWAGATLGFSVIASGAAVSQTDGALKPAVMVTVSPQSMVDVPRAAVLDRILSFDVNGDGRIARDELPERMEPLVNRGDANDDGFLARDEVMALVSTPSGPRRIQRAQLRSTGHFTGVLEDLKLPPATHEAALAIIREHTVPDQVNVSKDFDAAMRHLLETEDYENFMAAAARLRTTRREAFSGGAGGGIRPQALTPIPPAPRAPR